MAFNIGDTVGDYQIIGILGAGGMGKVYKVRNVISDRVEALKVLLPNLANEPELADRFVREIKLLASLDHPNIAALHTALRVSNQLLMVMEFVEGATLEKRLEQGPLPPEEAVACVSQVLAALGYAHERGIIHRDIKPANMMRTASGTVKLMDFGIAKAAADRRLTMTGTTMGSLYYMSPEQVKGTSGLDGRSDLYSVGVSLYELVTGTRPFRGDSDYAIMVAHLEKDPVPPIEVDPKLPPALNEIILTAIQRDPANRFQSAQAFRGALATLGAPSGVPPATQTLPRPASGPAAVPVAPVPAARSHRGLYMALGALVVLAVLVAAAIQLPRFFRTKAGEEPPVASEQVPAQTPQPPAVPAQQEGVEAPPAGTEVPQPLAPAQQAATPVERATPVRPEAGGVATSRAKDIPSSAPPGAAGTVLRQTPGQAPPASLPEQHAAQPSEPQAAPRTEAAPAEAAESPALQEQRERIILIGTRANALRSSLQNLEQQQRRAGLGLRGDVATSWKRMEAMLDAAENALKVRDAPAAKRNLDMAEREADRLDQFLGR